MSKQGTRYDEEFKRTLVDLYHNGKTQASLVKEYTFDNACCESFFKYLKKEESNRRNFRTYQQLYQSVFSYIEGFKI